MPLPLAIHGGMGRAEIPQSLQITGKHMKPAIPDALKNLEKQTGVPNTYWEIRSPSADTGHGTKSTVALAFETC